MDRYMIYCHDIQAQSPKPCSPYYKCDKNLCGRVIKPLYIKEIKGPEEKWLGQLLIVESALILVLSKIGISLCCQQRPPEHQH